MDNTMDDIRPCHLLTKLPPELRIRIYEDILRFDRPIKLRQHVAGSADTAILRTSRQIHQEALSVLYDINVISATRNDFCNSTDGYLKTPVDRRQARHLRFTSFGESIACNLSSARCSVCADSASGLLQALKSMPQLKSVIIDYSLHINNFRRFWNHAHECSMGYTISCVGVGVYKVRGHGFENVDFKFHHRCLAGSWAAIEELFRLRPSTVDEEATLSRLRSAYGSVPDILRLLFGARSTGHTQHLEIGEVWIDENDIQAMTTDKVRSSALHEFTVALQKFLGSYNVLQVGQMLELLRDMMYTA